MEQPKVVMKILLVFEDFIEIRRWGSYDVQEVSKCPLGNHEISSLGILNVSKDSSEVLTGIAPVIFLIYF